MSRNQIIAQRPPLITQANLDRNGLRKFSHSTVEIYGNFYAQEPGQKAAFPFYLYP